MIGAKETRRFVAGKHIQLNMDVSDGLANAGEYLKKEVKQSIRGFRAEKRSVDTGEFLNSVEVHTENKTVIVSSDAKQAKILEHGTSKIKPRRHFNNSADRNKNKMKDIIGLNIRNKRGEMKWTKKK